MLCSKHWTHISIYDWSILVRQTWASTCKLVWLLALLFVFIFSRNCFYHFWFIDCCWTSHRNSVSQSCHQMQMKALDIDIYSAQKAIAQRGFLFCASSFCDRHETWLKHKFQSIYRKPTNSSQKKLKLYLRK